MVSDALKGFLYLAGIFLVFIFLGCLVYSIAIPQPVSLPKIVDYKNHVTGLNLIGLTSGNYNYSINITNSYDNISIVVYSFLFSDPENLTQYVNFNCSVKNATILNPSQTISATFFLNIIDNPYNNGELYIRIGSLRQGEDY